MRVVIAVTLGFLSVFPALDDGVQSPKDVYGSRPNNLAQIPSGWAVDNPIQLQVLFNLKYPPNSPEADAFLAEYGRFERSLPFKGQTTISRVLAPAKFAYAGRLTFANWRDYRTYKESPTFRRWYFAVWKPAVTETEELFTVLDAKASGQ